MLPCKTRGSSDDCRVRTLDSLDARDSERDRLLRWIGSGTLVVPCCFGERSVCDVVFDIGFDALAVLDVVDSGLDAVLVVFVGFEASAATVDFGDFDLGTGFGGLSILVFNACTLPPGT